MNWYKKLTKHAVHIDSLRREKMRVYWYVMKAISFMNEIKEEINNVKLEMRHVESENDLADLKEQHESLKEIKNDIYDAIKELGTIDNSPLLSREDKNKKAQIMLNISNLINATPPSDSDKLLHEIGKLESENKRHISK